MYKNKAIRIMLYVLSLLVLLYFLYAGDVAFGFIGNLVSSEEIELGSSIGKIVQYSMTNTFSYLFYSIVFVCMGYIVGQMLEDTRNERDIRVVKERVDRRIVEAQR